MVQEPRMESADFDRVKSQLEGVMTSDQGMPSYVAQVSFLMAAYGPKHPYAYPSKGTLKSLNQLDLPRVKQAHHQNFGPNNAALIIVGDAKMADVKKLAKTIFGSWKKINYVPQKMPAPVVKKHMETHLVSRPHTPQTYLLVGQPVATAQDKDLASLEVFQGILAGLPSSRLDGNLREKKGWTYGVGSTVNPLRGLGPMMISSSIQVPFGADALGEILKEFEVLKKEPIADEELKAAKEGLLHSFASRYSTVEKIAGNVANRFVYDLSSDYDEKYYNRIHTVSKEDMMAIAQRVFNKEKMVAVAVGELEVMQVPLGTMDVGKVSVEMEEKTEEKPSN
ncbi:MAG: Peptidase M16 inactive domain protein [bacterium ADurb.BinA186]|nr:MAG: Peptidase M16 inactive domain protein [bacterium ADurb.BinA186]